MQERLKLFGKQIAEIRARNNLTQEQLAERIGYSTNHISKLELARTNPSFDLIVKIANALNIEEKELFNFPNPKEAKKELAKKIFYELQTLNEKDQQLVYNIIKTIKQS